MHSSVITCNVRHRPGSQAERICPVHGDGGVGLAAAMAPRGLAGAVESGEFEGASGQEYASRVPGYDESVFRDGGRGGLDFGWLNPKGELHRVDGPARLIQDHEMGVDIVRAEWYVDGNRANMVEVYGRFMEAMSDGVIPSTDTQALTRLLVYDEILEVDPASRTISVRDQERFDQFVDRFERTFASVNKDRARQVRISLDPDREEEWDTEWVDGDWMLHRPFGRALPTDDDNHVHWWWHGTAQTFNGLILRSLHEASGGKIALDNYRAAEFVAKHSMIDPGHEIRLIAYQHHPWEELAEAIAKKFPNPEPGATQRYEEHLGPGEPNEVKWVTSDKIHRTDGAATYYIPSGSRSADDCRPRYALDGVQVSREKAVSAYIKEKTGVHVSPENDGALSFLEEAVGLGYGDFDNDFTFTHADNLSETAQLAVQIHPNTDR